MTLQLKFNKEWDRFVLSDPKIDTKNASFEMVIDKYWPDRTDYVFVCWCDGEWIELVRPNTFKERVRVIAEHEGQEVADAWTLWQMEWQQVSPDHAIFKLQAKWEAMQELELFEIPVSLRQWKSPEMSAEARRVLDHLREKYLREIHDEAFGAVRGDI